MPSPSTFLVDTPSHEHSYMSPLMGQWGWAARPNPDYERFGFESGMMTPQSALGKRKADFLKA